MNFDAGKALPSRLGSKLDGFKPMESRYLLGVALASNVGGCLVSLEVMTKKSSTCYSERAADTTDLQLQLAKQDFSTIAKHKCMAIACVLAY